MKCEGWISLRIADMVEFNPRESIPKNRLAKKVAMEKLSPHQKVIDGYELGQFTGGTKFRNGDTLLARITPCLENGKTAKVSILEDNEVGFGSTEFIVLRNKPGMSDSDFIYYIATSPVFRDIAIKSMVGTSGRQRVQQDSLENTVMNFPPLPEQRAIAATLSCLDDKIELNNRMNKTLEEMAQAIFKSWFVDFEPFQDGEFVDSELGRIPKGWRVGTLGEITEQIYSGGTPSTMKPEYWDGTLPWLSSGETGSSYITMTQKRITQQGVDGSSTRKAFAYDTVIASAGQGYTRGQTSLLLIDTYINQSVVVLHSNPLLRLYIFIALQKRYDELRAISDAHSIRGSLTTKMLSGLCILVPSKNVIEKFNIVYEALLQQIVQYQFENHSLISIRDSLLPKLMNGEIQIEMEENV